MAPGPTFERVYRALKKQLKDGRFAPGERLEPAALSADLNASVTPIRDALHRLVGERLVETPRHNGFRSPLMTEIALRDLYRWNADLLSLALRSAPRNTSPDTGPAPIEELPAEDTDVAAATAHFFTQIGRGAVHAELALAIDNASDRLHGLRLIEPELFDDAASELDRLVQLRRAGEGPALRRAIAGYHRRRNRAAPHLLERLHRAPPFDDRPGA